MELKLVVFEVLPSQAQRFLLKANARKNCDKGVRLNRVQTMHDRILTTESKGSQVLHDQTYHESHVCDKAYVPTGNVLIESRCFAKLWQMCQAEPSGNHAR